MERKKRMMLLLAIFALAAFTTTAHASAYSQALNLNNDGGPSSGPNEQVADAFQLSAATSLTSRPEFCATLASTSIKENRSS